MVKQLRKSKHQGISLISVLIGLAISSGLVLAIAQAFIMAKQSYQLAVNITDMYNRIETAMDTVERYFDMAGYGGFNGVIVPDGVSLDIAIANDGQWSINKWDSVYGDEIVTQVIPKSGAPAWTDLAGNQPGWTSWNRPILAIYGGNATGTTVGYGTLAAGTLFIANQDKTGSNGWVSYLAPIASDVEYFSHMLGEMDHNAGVSRWIYNSTSTSNGYNLDAGRVIAAKVALAFRTRDEVLRNPAPNGPIQLFARDNSSSATTGKTCFCPGTGMVSCSATCNTPDKRIRKVMSRTFYFKSYVPPKRRGWCAYSYNSQTNGYIWQIQFTGVYTPDNNASFNNVNNISVRDAYDGSNPGANDAYVYKTLLNARTTSPMGNQPQPANTYNSAIPLNGATQWCQFPTSYHAYSSIGSVLRDGISTPDPSSNARLNKYNRTFPDNIGQTNGANACMDYLEAQIPTWSSDFGNNPSNNYPYIPGCADDILMLYCTDPDQCPALWRY